MDLNLASQEGLDFSQGDGKVPLLLIFYFFKISTMSSISHQGYIRYPPRSSKDIPRELSPH